MEEKPKVPFANIIAGDTLYWVCIIASVFAMIGPCIGILFPDNNVANPFLVFDLLWEGKSAKVIWEVTTSAGKFPGPHFWIEDLTKGDAISQLGLWLGCVCALPAAFFAGLTFLFKKNWMYWLMSWWVCFTVIYAMMA